LFERDGAFVAKHRRVKKGLRFSLDFAGLNHVAKSQRRRVAVRFSRIKIRTPIHCRDAA
jgi:hypothetical protein